MKCKTNNSVNEMPDEAFELTEDEKLLKSGLETVFKKRSTAASIMTKVQLMPKPHKNADFGFFERVFHCSFSCLCKKLAPVSFIVVLAAVSMFFVSKPELEKGNFGSVSLKVLSSCGDIDSVKHKSGSVLSLNLQELSAMELNGTFEIISNVDTDFKLVVKGKSMSLKADTKNGKSMNFILTGDDVSVVSLHNINNNVGIIVNNKPFMVESSGGLTSVNVSESDNKSVTEHVKDECLKSDVKFVDDSDRKNEDTFDRASENQQNSDHSEGKAKLMFRVKNLPEEEPVYPDVQTESYVDADRSLIDDENDRKVLKDKAIDPFEGGLIDVKN